MTKANFAEIIRTKMAAVVQIYVTGYVGEEVKSILNPRLGNLDEWSGSGFFVQCKYGDDIIVTNAHVVRNARTIEIMSMLTSEETFQAELIGIVKNQEPDIAILRLKAGELKRFNLMAKGAIPYLALSGPQNEKKISRGMPIRAFGYPLGMTEPNITTGEITNFASGTRHLSPKYVTDAAINPGNSGGPSIDENGEVIGINTSIIQDADNIGFITPSSFISIILENIFDNNSIAFSDLGGEFQKNSHTVAMSLGMPDTSGIIVSTIEENGFFDHARIKSGDVILSFNNKPLDRHGIFIGEAHQHRKNIFDEIKLIPIGTEIHIKLWRDRKEKTITAKTRAFPTKNIQSRPIITERKFIDLWGMTIQPLSFEILGAINLIDPLLLYQLLKNNDGNREPLIITYLEKESPAYQQEWTLGEVLDSINEIKIESLETLIDFLNSDKSEIYLCKSICGKIGYFRRADLPPSLKILNPTFYLR